MGREQDIAIIGMAGRFPDASTLEHLHQNLRNGIDSIRDIPEDRIRATTIDPNGKYRRGAYLQDVDKFDCAFFNIAKGEAQAMDPSVRMLLEVAHDTFENAGYAPEHFSGTRCAVFVAEAITEYYKHADGFRETLITGNSPAFFPTRISKQFNLTGNAVMVNTSCSSSHTALHMAINEILWGEAEHALVCATNLSLFPFFDSPNEMDLWSEDGKSRAFSANATGISSGEIIAVLLLKPLARAVDDGDVIHAVIRGSAINNNANRSKSPFAPDSVTQSEVIRFAWQKAGIRAKDVGFIETHGSGTQLGDPLEVEGLNLAFGAETDEKKVCPISTIKSNAGHTMSGAGMFGLVKTILQLRHREIYPTIHAQPPNPLIDFERSAVFVNHELRPWEPRNGGPLLAGVTSLGASGTNVHVVLEEAPARTLRASSSLTGDGAFLVPLSARSEPLLDEYRTTLREFLVRAADRIRLADVAYTLSAGRRHGDVRAAFVVSSVQELIAALGEPLRAERTNPRARALWLLSDQDGDVEPILEAWRSAPCFERHVEACREHLDLGDPRARLFTLEYALYRTLCELGGALVNVVPVGLGSVALKAASGEMALAHACAELPPFASLANVEERAKALIERVLGKGDGPIRCVDLAGTSDVSRAIAKVTAGDGAVRMHALVPEGTSPVLRFFADLHRGGHTIEWQKFALHQKGARIELPPYPFEKTRCWLREQPRLPAETAPVVPLHPEPSERKGSVSETIALIWREVLQTGDIQPASNFFDLGGHSLLAYDIIVQVRDLVGVDLEFEEILDHPTLDAFGKYVEQKLSTTHHTEDAR